MCKDVLKEVEIRKMTEKISEVLKIEGYTTKYLESGINYKNW